MIGFNLMKSTSVEIEKLLKHIPANSSSSAPVFLPHPLLLWFFPSLISCCAPPPPPPPFPVLPLDIYASMVPPLMHLATHHFFLQSLYLSLPPTHPPPLSMLNGLHYCNELVIYGGGVQDLYHLPIECLASLSSPSPCGNACIHSESQVHTQRKNKVVCRHTLLQNHVLM